MNVKRLKSYWVWVVAFVSMISMPIHAASPLTGGGSIVVDTHLGKVKGVVEENTVTFYGVPYALNPFDEGRRFKAPQAMKPWSGVLDATTLTAPVPQPSRDMPTKLVGAPGNLTLNIWAPTLEMNASKRLPVMVWIPGGAFIREDASEAVYDGKSFAKHGVIVVGVNYRVGVDGFMHIKGAPDNRGILDQILALHWVQNNIADFGGDPQRVTLFGQSAGAESVAVLMGTKKAKGLFQKAIMQSPPMQVLTKNDAKQLAREFADKLNVSPSIKDISSISYQKLVEMVIDLGNVIKNRDDWGELSWGGTAFLPVIDNDLIPDTPMTNLSSGADPSIPVIVGSTDQEARLYLVPGGQIDRIEADQISLFQKDFNLNKKPANIYTQKNPGQTLGDVYADMLSDYTFRMPALHIAEKLVKNGNPVWHYNFSWRSPMFGAAHFVDVPFAFNTVQTSQAKLFLGNEPPESLAKAMHSQWAGFAKTGRANWMPYNLSKRTTMRFDVQSQEVDDPEKAVRVLWENHHF